MSLEGASFTATAQGGGAHVQVSVGAAGNLFTAGFTVVTLAQHSNSNCGLFAGLSGGLNGTFQGEYTVDTAALFGTNDFSSGYPVTVDNTWKWYVWRKPAGSAHYRFSIGTLSVTPTWSHGEAVGSGNHGNAAAVDVFTLGAGHYALTYGNLRIAAQAVFTSNLSDAAVEAACTTLAQDLKNAGPAAGWLFKATDIATAGSIVDFTGGGANETSRTSVVMGAEPANFDYTLSSGTPNGSAATDLAMDLAASGRRKSAGSAPPDLAIDVAVAGRRKSQASATPDIAIDLAASGQRKSQASTAPDLAIDVAVAGRFKASAAGATDLAIDVAAVGHAPTIGVPQGSADVSLLLDASVAGQRKSAGSAAPDLVLDLAAAGRVSVRGSAVLDLALDWGGTGRDPAAKPPVAHPLLLLSDYGVELSAGYHVGLGTDYGVSLEWDLD